MQVSSVTDLEKFVCVCVCVLGMCAGTTSLCANKKEVGVEVMFKAAAPLLQRQAERERSTLVPTGCSEDIYNRRWVRYAPTHIHLTLPYPSRPVRPVGTAEAPLRMQGSIPFTPSHRFCFGSWVL